MASHRITPLRSVTLFEYGPEVPVSLSADEAAEVASVGARWETILGLNSNPLRVSRVAADHYALRAEQVTGVIAAGPLHIEIVPKFLEDPTAGDAWRQTLWNILSLVHEVPLTLDQTAAEATRDDSFIDLLAQVFMRSLNQGSLRGFPRGYVEVEKSEPVLRGSLNTREVIPLLLRPWEIPCRVDLLTEDIPINRLLRWALQELSAAVRSPQRARSLTEVQLSFHHVQGGPPSILLARRLTLGLQHQALQPALRIATMLLEGKMLEPRPAKEELEGFLWHSTKVYEAFVMRLAQQAARRVGCRAIKRTRLMASPIDAPWRLTTTPDVQIAKGKELFLVMDAKYKARSGRPDASDSYQVISGGKVLECEEVLLVYPQLWGETSRTYRWTLVGSGRPNRLGTVSLDLRHMRSVKGESKLVLDLEEVIRARVPQ